MAVTIVSDIFDGITNAINADLGNNISQIMVTVSPFFFAVFGLYAVYMAFKYMYDPPDILVMDVVKNIGALGIVTFFAFNAGNYNTYVVPFVLNAGDDIAKALGAKGTIAGQIDGLIERIANIVVDMFNKVKFSLTDPSPFVNTVISAALVIIGSVLFIFVSASFLLVAKIMVSLLLVVGPIFIAFAFFPATRSNFQSWTGQCMNYILLIILYSIAFSLEIVLIEKFALFNGSELLQQWMNSLKLLIAMLIFTAVSKEIPSLASQLSGGIGISGLAGSFASGSVGGAMGGLATMMGAKSASKYLGGKRDAAGSWAKGKVKDGVAGAFNKVMGRGSIKP